MNDRSLSDSSIAALGSLARPVYDACLFAAAPVASLADLGVAASMTEVDRVLRQTFEDLFGATAAVGDIPLPAAARV